MVKNHNLDQKSKFWLKKGNFDHKKLKFRLKIEILIKEGKFWSQKINVSVKNWNFGQKSQFFQISVKILLKVKILINTAFFNNFVTLFSHMPLLNVMLLSASWAGETIRRFKKTENYQFNSLSRFFEHFLSSFWTSFLVCFLAKYVNPRYFGYISIFPKKKTFSIKISIFGQKFVFSPKFRFFTKISIFCQNFNISPKF